jgi:hypothetical protein
LGKWQITAFELLVIASMVHLNGTGILAFFFSFDKKGASMVEVVEKGVGIVES